MAVRRFLSDEVGEYRAIDLSQWIATTPRYLLTDHFGKAQTLAFMTTVFIAYRR
jgi:hypothetical protein